MQFDVTQSAESNGTRMTQIKRINPDFLQLKIRINPPNSCINKGIAGQGRNDRKKRRFAQLLVFSF
jgi:hypothetical protein